MGQCELKLNLTANSLKIVDMSCVHSIGECLPFCKVVQEKQKNKRKQNKKTKTITTKTLKRQERKTIKAICKDNINNKSKDYRNKHIF